MPTLGINAAHSIVAATAILTALAAIAHADTPDDANSNPVIAQMRQSETQQAQTTVSEPSDSDIQLASILPDQPDPFASSSNLQPTPEWGDQHENNGNVHFALDFAYANRYFYRGIDHDSVASHGSSLNLLIDGRLEFDFAQYPHPYVEIFTNIYDADPVSRFQEVRPIVGANWDLKPFDLDLSSVNYIYPNRENLNYPEVDFKVTLDDYLLLNSDKPILSPYVLGAFEYQKYEGWYIETGIKHDFDFQDFGLVVTPEACVAWVTGLKQQFVFIDTVRNTGWQHVEVGLTISYSLNFLLGVSNRYGDFDVKGYGFYDDRLNARITASTGLWGGIGLGFKY